MAAGTTVCRTVAEMRAVRAAARGARVAFVPTMGCLHDGHLALGARPPSRPRHAVARPADAGAAPVARARALCPLTVVSVFVNPAQFSASEDFATYPRQEARDVELLRGAGVSAVFLPTSAELYRDSSANVLGGHGTFVTVKGSSEQLEGRIRPHFFTGVATVLCKLFNIVQPDDVFFGQKARAPISATVQWSLADVAARDRMRSSAWSCEISSAISAMLRTYTWFRRCANATDLQ